MRLGGGLSFSYNPLRAPMKVKVIHRHLKYVLSLDLQVSRLTKNHGWSYCICQWYGDSKISNKEITQSNPSPTLRNSLLNFLKQKH